MKPVLDNMINKIKPLKIYNTDSGTNVYNELLVYSKALENMLELANDLLKEVVITTADNYGLYMREKLWGVPRTDLSTDERRKSILKRFGMNFSDFTLSGMTEFLSSLGIEADITEVNDKYRIYIYATNGENFPFSLRKYLTQQINEFFPAHCQVFVDYRKNGTWDDLDQKKTMFDTYELFNYTWERLESFE